MSIQKNTKSVGEKYLHFVLSCTNTTFTILFRIMWHVGCCCFSPNALRVQFSLGIPVFLLPE